MFGSGRGLRRLIVAAATGLAAGTAVGQSTLRIIDPPEPGGSVIFGAMTADGGTLFTQDFSSQQIYRWTPGGGYEPIGWPAGAVTAGVTAASGSGDALAINARLENVDHTDAGRWTSSMGFVIFPGNPLLWGQSVLRVSDGGVWTLGHSAGTGAVLWNTDGEEIPLPNLPGAPVGSYPVAFDMSADGSVIVGASAQSEGAGIVWGPDRQPVPVSRVVGRDSVRSARFVSAEGSTFIGGIQLSPHDSEWYRYTPGTGVRAIGPRPGQQEFLVGPISKDGRVVYLNWIIGIGRNELGLWTPDAGFVHLLDYLQQSGVDLSGWDHLSITCTSYDGRVFAGYGMLDGVQRSFFVTMESLPPATNCAADWDYSGEVNSADFFAFLSGFFLGAADFDGSGQTNSQDFFEFLTAFFAGC